MPTHTHIHYPGADVLRGVAIILVVFYHLFEYTGWFRFGWLGVDLFFVLSGFLITNILIGTCDTTKYLEKFYIRRALRIFPLYFFVLLVFYLLSSYLFTQKHAGSTYGYYSENKLWFWTYMQNWLLIIKGSPPVPYLTHFWSLAVEEQFYLIWPLIVLYCSTKTYLKKVATLLVFSSLVIRCFIYIQAPADVHNYYYNTFTRMDTLMCGALLAISLPNLKDKQWLMKWLFVIGAFFFLLLLLLYKRISQKDFLTATVGYTIIALFFASMLYFFLGQKNSFVMFLSRSAILKFIAKISYGIYVFHLPIYLIVSMKYNLLLSTYFRRYPI